MPKRCPKCKTLNSGSALRCANPNCDHQFSADSPAMPQPPAPAAPAAVPQPVTDPQTQIAHLHLEVAELRELVDRLDKDPAEQQREPQRLVVEHQPTPQSVSSDSTVRTPAWMAKALGLAALWPKATSIVTAVMALGAGYGGLASYRDLVSPSVKAAPVEPSSPDVDQDRRSTADQDVRSTALDNREGAVSNRESQLDTREVGLKARETDMAVREKGLKLRTDEVTAQAKAALPAEARVGFFDFMMPKGRGSITLYKVGVRGAWPSRDCAIVAVTPLDRDEVPASFASSCTSERIVLERPNGVPGEKVVRVVWQLNGTAPTATGGR